MNDLLILGTDTDAGKTTFALLWLSLFAEEYEYWKPLESGASDTANIQALVPQAFCHPRLFGFRQAVAPALAARSEGVIIPSAERLAGNKPQPTQSQRHLLIESFGSPFSPLNEDELQIALIRELSVPAILVSSSAIGAIGRTLQCLRALQTEGIQPAAVVLLGPPDEYALEQLRRQQPGMTVLVLQPPSMWDKAGVQKAAQEQQSILTQLRPILAPPIPVKRNVGSAAHSRCGPLQMPDETAAQILASDQQHVWHPYTSLHEPDPPLLAVAAQDEFLYLADGRTIIDGISSWWTILHGHRPPLLMNALAAAMQEVDHVLFAGVTHPYAVRLAELLLSSAPWPDGKVFYSDNGSTAVEVALKMAYQFWCHHDEPQRTLFIGFEHGYHGDTFGAMAASRDPLFFGRFEPLLFQTKIVPVAAERLAAALSEHRGKVAAVILEPLVQGAGGMRMHTPEELRAIFEVTRAHDVLFIADEVMTGGGRLGPLWAHRAAEIAPDLICASKTIAGGVLPIAATLVSPRLVSAWATDDRSKTFFHGHSFTAHPLACAVGVANWNLLMTQPSNTPQRMEAFWQQALAPLQTHPLVRELRIHGSIAAVELNLPGGYLAAAARQLRQHCLQRGVFLRPLGNVLYAMPPLQTSQNSLEQIAAAMISAVHALKA